MLERAGEVKNLHCHSSSFGFDETKLNTETLPLARHLIDDCFCYLKESFSTLA